MQIEVYNQLKHQKAVQDLVLDIQNTEFHLNITTEDQPDLPDLESFYQQNGGMFWVALHEQKVIGCIGFQSLDTENAVLRKMFIQKDFRGKESNLALQLLQTLEDFANQHLYKIIWLDTPLVTHAAHRFYEKNGFKEISIHSIPKNYKLPQGKFPMKIYQKIL